MKPLLIINLILAALAFVAHMAVVMAQHSGSAPGIVSYWILLPLVAGELCIIALSAVGLWSGGSLRAKLFQAQSLLIALFGTSVVVMLFRALPYGAYPGTGFWVPMVGSGFVAYCVFVLIKAFPNITSLRPWQPALFAWAGLLIVEIAVVNS